MSFASRVAQIAAELASNAEFDASALKAELAETEARKMQIEKRLETANLAIKRFSGFKPEINGSLQCPRCWIVKEARSPLLPIGRDGSQEFLSCHECYFGLVVEKGGHASPESVQMGEGAVSH